VLYLRICFDKAGAGDLRETLREEHRAYLRSGAIKLIQAGPMCVSDADDTNLGSFMVLDADSLAEVETFHNGDPFTMGGVYGDVRLVRWDKHIG